MMSAEARSLERFADNFVAPGSTGMEPQVPMSDYNWINSNSTNMPYGDGNSLQNNQAYFNQMGDGQLQTSYPVIQSPVGNGTEIWGERPSGNQWRAVALKSSLQDWQLESRPEIQNRSSPWSQPFHQQMPAQMQQPTPMTIPVESLPSTMYQEQPTSAPNSNQIQSLVCNLIRQNNMKKPYNFPPWVDVTKPPPPLPDFIPPQSQMQYNSAPENNNSAPLQNYNSALPQNNGQFNPSYSHIRPPQAFTNSAQQVPLSKMHDPALHQARNQLEPQGNNYQQNVEYHAGGDNGPVFKNIATPSISQQYDHELQSLSVQPQTPCATLEQHQPFQNPLVYDNLDNSSLSDLRKNSFQNDQVVESNVENKDYFEMPQLQEALPPLANFKEVQKPSILADHVEKKAVSEKPQNMLNNSHGQFRSAREPANNSKDSVKSEMFDRQTSEEPDSMPAQPCNKRSFHRQPSAADLDMDWRRRDDDHQDTKRQSAGRTHRYSSDEYETRNQRQIARQSSGDSDVFKPSLTDESLHTSEDRHTMLKEAKRATDSFHGETGGQRHLTQLSKVKLLCLLQQNDEASSDDSVGKEIRHLQISDSETDLSKFIEVTQCFATNEAKMREVAEMLCNKAINNHRYSRNVSLLCDRLSNMMVHGTKFRNVILNVMQGHYKNRELLFSASFRQDKRWFGFVTFLVELFLNLRTATRERLLVLTTPVSSCLFQVLSSDKVDQKHINCFGRMFRLVGPVLESECPLRLDDLMQEIRDRCVLSKSAFVKRVLLHCVEFYSSKWERQAC